MTRTLTAICLAALGSATLAACGGASSPNQNAAGAGGPRHGATAQARATPRRALSAYGACLHEHGVPRLRLTPHETSAELETRRHAAAACRPVLMTALRALKRSGHLPTSTLAARTRPPATKATETPGSTSTPTSTAPRIKPAATPAPVTAALTHFTACMHEHGITAFPEPEGARFNMTHVELDRSSPQFKAAEKACTPILQAIG